MNGARDWSELLSASLNSGVLITLLRVTLVLLVAWLAHGLLRNANPRWRILVWRAAAVGTVIIAGFSVAGPLVTLPMLPVAAESATSQTMSFQRLDSSVGERESDPPQQVGQSSAAAATNSTPLQRPVEAGTALPVVDVSSEPVVATENVSLQPGDVVGGIFLVWLIGVAAVLFRMLVGVAQVSRICRETATVPVSVEEELARVRQHFELSPTIIARQTDAVTTPCSVGFVRGMILLPRPLCQEERREELRAALMHEAAHVHGDDLKWNHLLHAIATLLWFHPLAWRIRLVHADACDERCDAEAAEYVGGPETYGRSLARIALTASGRTAPATLAMARRAVNRRIDMLKLGRGRSRLRTRRTVVVIAAIGCLILAVAATGIGPSMADDEGPAKDSAASNPVTEGSTAPKKIVRIVDPDGKPVNLAIVEPTGIAFASGSSMGWPANEEGKSEPPKLTTDARGVVEIALPPITDLFEGTPATALWCRVAHPDFAETTNNFVPIENDQLGRVTHITLQRGAVVEIVALSDDQPLPADRLFALTASQSQTGHRPLTAGPDGTLRLPRLPAGKDLLRLAYLPEEGPPLLSDVHELSLENGEQLTLRIPLRDTLRVEGQLADVVPRPIRNGRIVATVVDNVGDLAENKAPVAIGWQVWGTIAEDGTFTLTDLPRGNLQVIALCDGFMATPGEVPEFATESERRHATAVNRPQVFSVTEETTRITVAMSPTAEALVRVQDSAGQAAPGADVSFSPNVGWWGGLGSTLYAHALYSTREWLTEAKTPLEELRKDSPYTATTDNDGTAIVRNLPPGSQHFYVTTGDLDLPTEDMLFQQGTIDVVAGEQAETTVTLTKSIDLSTPPDAAVPESETGIPKPQPPKIVSTEADETELAGVVIDEQGRPLEGVAVDAWTWHPGNETTTDAEGRFRLKGFEPSEAVEVEFTKDGYSPSLYVSQKAGTDDWTVTLTQGTWLEGTVLDPAGSPVPGALVRAARGPFRNPQVVIGEVWTDVKAGADGRYKLLLEAGTYDVQVRQPDTGVVRHSQIELAMKEKKRLDLRLEKGVTFRAHVLDSVTGDPVEGIVLWNWRQPGIEGVSDENGVLEIPGMTEGEFEFSVTAEGVDRRKSSVAGNYARWWSPSAVHEHQRGNELDRNEFPRSFDDLTFHLAGETYEVKVFVEPAVSITGRVVDPDGKPVSGATVAPAKTGSGNSITGDTRYSYETDAEGRFTMALPASNDAEYNLIAHDGKYREWRTWANGAGEPFRTKPGDKVAGVELRLTQPAAIRGRVTDSLDRPRRNVEVRAAAADKRDNRYYVPMTTTDDEGRYELRFVASGRHFVQVEPFWLDAEQAPKGTTQTITVEAGQSLESIDFTVD